LVRLLDAVADLDWDGHLDVVVIDNDAAGEGIAICRQRADDYPWPMVFGHEPRRGISFARNRAVAMALARAPDFIAMLDDDEWPDRAWLKALTGGRLRVNTSTRPCFSVSNTSSPIVILRDRNRRAAVGDKAQWGRPLRRAFACLAVV
jgi:glycosyltransferase involved in cell wall biosynthesis